MSFGGKLSLVPRGENNGGGQGGALPPQYCLYHANLPPQNFGIGGHVLGAKPPKFDAVGAVLENFEQICRKKWPKNAI